MRNIVAEPRSLADVLIEEPVFVLSSDIDWASDYCIQILLDAFADFSIKPTLFVTHASRCLGEAGEAGRAELAIHPNFLPGSSHGAEPDEVIEHVRRLVPGARGSRGHCFATSSHITGALRAQGLVYDSGPLLAWQQNLTPLRNGFGLLHLPVFWEDDVHWHIEPDWSFARVADRFQRPGLKIINVHPFFHALNIPTARFYQDHKRLIMTLDAEGADAFRHTGPGCAVFTRELLSMIAASNFACCSLGDLYDWHQRDTRP